jgi:hypothetical protein
LLAQQQDEVRVDVLLALEEVGARVAAPVGDVDNGK